MYFKKDRLSYIFIIIDAHFFSGREGHGVRDNSLVPPPSFQRRASDGCASIGQLSQPSDVKSLQQEFHNLQVLFVGVYRT